MEAMRGFILENNTHTGSRENLRLASLWLQRCLQTHRDCNLGYELEPSLPTRILDVGPPDGSQQPVLYTTSHERGSYVALSHCWGKDPLLTTTSKTLSERETGIPLADLPKSFRHAVYVTRTMCVRYLWIDSLCILQDCKRDWEVESSKMADYYSDALFTIAADNASDATKGCFRPRSILDTRPIEISLKFLANPADEGVRQYVRRSAPTRLEPRYASRSPLQARGWTLQEEVLSRRLLVFGEDQLTFHCASDVASETHPEGWCLGGIAADEQTPKYTTLRRV